jgi:hypothetical protein
VSGPSPENADKLMQFGQFVGSWCVQWSGTGNDGQPLQVEGEFHFGWVLGGRAVQDTWIVPGRNQPRDPRMRAFHGTSAQRRLMASRTPQLGVTRIPIQLDAATARGRTPGRPDAVRILMAGKPHPEPCAVATSRLHSQARASG